MDDIFNMTIDQIRLYVKTCNELEKRDMKNAVVSALAGARYDEKSIEKLMRSLE